MGSKKTAILVFAVAIICLFIGLGIGASTTSTTTQTITQSFTETSSLTAQAIVTSVATVTVQNAGGSLVEYCFGSGYGTTTDCAGTVVKYINMAQKSIHILIYDFTLSSIRDALIQAKNRGVDVEIVMDHYEASGQYSQYNASIAAGLNVRLSNGAYEMHDKVAIIDGHWILTGSFNWTETANTRNDENLIVLDSQTWGGAYEQEFQTIWAASASS